MDDGIAPDPTTAAFPVVEATRFRRVPLTYAHLRAAKPPVSGRIELADTVERGLRYRLTSSGSASWSLLTTGPDGRQLRVTLGDGSIPLARARELAVDATVRLARGDNPTETKRRAKAAERAAREAEAARAAVPTVSALAARWQEAAKPDTSPKYRAEVAGVIRRAMGPAAYEATLADSVTARGFDMLVGTARRRGDGEARHLVAVARTLFGWAERTGIIPADLVAEWLGQQRGGRKQLPRWMAQPARERVLEDVEVARLWRTVSGEEFSIQVRAFVALLLLTGCRAGEIAGLDWSEVDLEAGSIRLPRERTKNRTPHAVALGGRARGALTDLAPPLGSTRRPPVRGHVFGGGVRNNTGRMLIAVRAATGLREHWTWHDLRRTVATGLARMGCPVHVTEAVLNHVQGEKTGLARVYQRHDYREESREWLLRWQARVGDVCGVAVALLKSPRDPDGVGWVSGSA